MQIIYLVIKIIDDLALFSSHIELLVIAQRIKPE